MRVLKGGVQAYFSAIRGNSRMTSMASKFDVVKFDGTGNFGLWQTRVKDLLAQQGFSKTLSDQKPEKVDDDKWEEMQAQACATITLCLSIRSCTMSWIRHRRKKFGTSSSCKSNLCPRH